MNTVFRMMIVLSVCSGVASSADFSVYERFPTTARYNVVGTALPDGRLLLWNGDKIFVQQSANVDRFEQRASGYQGDPAFAILSPGGNTVLLGAGGYDGDPYLDKIYRISPNGLQDYSPQSVAATIPHFAAAFLTESLVLIDAGAGDWMNSLLVIHGFSGAKAAPVPVVRKPPVKGSTVVHKPGYSAAITVDHVHGRVYVMDAASLELRSFSLTALINAYNTHTTLEWAAAGTLIGNPGMYFNGGVSGITAAGQLVIGGALGWGMAGGVQLVNPATGVVEKTLDPGGHQAYTSVIYNPVTDRITALSLGLTYLQGDIAKVPAAGWLGLMFLAVFSGTVIARRARKP